MTVLSPNLELNDSGMEEASETFQTVFHKTWALIPRGGKKVINTFFMARPTTVYLCYEMDREDGKEAWAKIHWNVGGRTIIAFLAPFIMHGRPIEAVMGVVGHELAHIYRAGSDIQLSDNDTEEKETRRLCGFWHLLPEPSKY